MEGGSNVQIHLTFPTGLNITEVVNLTAIQALYQLEFSFYYVELGNVSNGSMFPCVDAFLVTYDSVSGLASVNCTTTPGWANHL